MDDKTNSFVFPRAVRKQRVVVSDIHKESDTLNVYIFRAVSCTLMPFVAGQFLVLYLDAGAAHTGRAYSIASSPADASERGFYKLAIEKYDGGFFPNCVHEQLKIGSELFLSEPLGECLYDSDFDTKHILCLTGGSAATPFLSMAHAIDEGTLDCDMTMLFGAATRKDIVFRSELEKLGENKRIRIVYVLSDEKADGFEHGFFTSALIAKYCPCSPCSLFICGPGAMYEFVDRQLADMGYDERYVHREPYAFPHDLSSAAGYTGDANAVYNLSVLQGGETRTIPARANEPLLISLERTGYSPAFGCRSGECGFCKSELLAGKVYCACSANADHSDDAAKGFIHPCYTFPLSDLSIVIREND